MRGRTSNARALILPFRQDGAATHRPRAIFNIVMVRPDKSQLERLMALAEEAEQILAQSIGSHDIRHACALARGYLDLARSYNEPVNIEDVELVLARMRAWVAKPGRRKNATDCDRGIP